MGWLAVAAALILLLLVPIGLSLLYNEDGGAAWMTLGPVRLRLYPSKKNKAQKKPDDNFAKTKTAKKGGSYSDFLPIVEDILQVLLILRRKIRVKRLEMNLVLADNDPCDLALNYGKAWAAVGNLMPRLEQHFVIKKRDIEVQCDFTASKTLIFARLDLTLSPGQLLWIALHHGTQILRKYSNIMQQRKGGIKL